MWRKESTDQQQYSCPAFTPADSSLFNFCPYLHHQASVDKLSPMGPFMMTLPFTVLPNDSVLTRKVQLKKDAPPTVWFTQLIIFPIDSIPLNDPNDPNNWIKSTDSKGKPIFIFNVAKRKKNYSISKSYY